MKNFIKRKLCFLITFTMLFSCFGSFAYADYAYEGLGNKVYQATKGDMNTMDAIFLNLGEYSTEVAKFAAGETFGGTAVNILTGEDTIKTAKGMLDEIATSGLSEGASNALSVFGLLQTSAYAFSDLGKALANSSNAKKKVLQSAKDLYLQCNSIIEDAYIGVYKTGVADRNSEKLIPYDALEVVDTRIKNNSKTAKQLRNTAKQPILFFSTGAKKSLNKMADSIDDMVERYPTALKIYNTARFGNPDYKWVDVKDVEFTLSYNSNGGKGSISSQTVSYGDTFTLASNKFTKDGYTFEGWHVKRSSDSKWYVSGEGWLTETQINNKDLDKKLYSNKAKLTFDGSWTREASLYDTYTFYAQWEKDEIPPSVADDPEHEYSLDHKTWKANDPYWKNVYLDANKKYKVGNYSAAVAVAIAIVDSGLKSARTFHPKNFVETAKKVGTLTSGGEMNWAKVNKTISNFDLYKDIKLEGKSVSGKIAEIKKWHDQNYEIIVQMPDCYVTVDKVSGDDVYMCDPKSNNTNLFDTYGNKPERILVYDYKGRKAETPTKEETPATLNNYTIKYNANSGEGSMSSMQLKHGDYFTLDECQFTKEGYGWAGWNVYRTSDQKWYVMGEGWFTNDELKKYGYTKKVYDSKTRNKMQGTWTNGASNNDTYVFYAMWAEEGSELLNNYTIGYHANFGEGSMSSMQLNHGDYFTLDKCKFTRDGYKCVGWHVYRTSDKKWYVTGKGWFTNNEIKEKNYTKAVYDSETKYKMQGTWTNGASNNDTYVFYAQWEEEKNNYTIKYNANSGEGSMSSMGLKHGDYFTLDKCKFTRDGYKWVGWNVYRTSDKKWYVMGKGWFTKDELKEYDYTKKVYDSETRYKMQGTWTNGASNNDTYIFYAMWEKKVPAGLIEKDGYYRIDVNMSKIRKIGKQDPSMCGAYALAYCRTIIDNKVANPYNYWIDGVGAHWKTGKSVDYGSNNTKAMQAAFAQISKGKPCVLAVYNRASWWNPGLHYVAVIGYKKGTTKENVNLYSFIVLDPCDATVYKMSDKVRYEYLKGGITNQVVSF